jgi:hypothetical protein
MKSENVKAFIGFLLGLSVIIVLGAAREDRPYNVKLSGDISTSTSTINYQSSFSGISPEGVCYLAITNTQDGYTNVFKVTEALNDSFNKNAFEKGQQGRVIVHPQK